jgi:hypothetical protein
MTTYNNFRMTTPGNKANMRLFLREQYLKQFYGAFYQPTEDEYDGTVNQQCQCPTIKSNKLKQGYNDASVSTATRISNILQTNSIGGKTNYGNSNVIAPELITFLDGREGQAGGLPRPPRNRF